MSGGSYDKGGNPGKRNTFAGGTSACLEMRSPVKTQARAVPVGRRMGVG